MPKRRANGEGNIRKRKDGRWEGRYTAGYDANGKVITKNVLGKTQAEVKDKLRAAIEDSKKLDPVKAGSYTLEQWLRLWYSVYIEPQVRYSTKEFYHNAIDHHIIPKLGSVKLEKLTMLQIQQFYNELLKSGRVQKKNQPELKDHGLSPRMVQCVHVVLNKALEHAVEEKLILTNPAKKCKIPKNTRKEMNILPEALIGQYLSAAKEHGILAPMYLELTTGLRCGELLALRWEDLDVQSRTLSINKSVARQDGKLVISTPKRQIPSERFFSLRIRQSFSWKNMNVTLRIRICSRHRVPGRHGIQTDSAGCTTGSSRRLEQNTFVFMTCDTRMSSTRQKFLACA